MQPRSHFREGDRADAADTILVEIGRVEVRAPQPPPAPVGTTEPDAGPQLSLAEYLRTRGLAK